MRLEEIDVGYKNGLYYMAFVYSKHKGNIIIKGQQDKVEEKIRKDFIPCVANFQRFRKRLKIRGFISQNTSPPWWRFMTDKKGIDTIHIKTPAKPFTSSIKELSEPRRSKFEFKTYRGHSGPLLSLRRIPKKWIPEYDALLTL